MRQILNAKQPSLPSAAQDEIRIGYVRFVTRGMSVIPIAGKPSSSIEDHITARPSTSVDGYDIAWSESLRAFRFERYRDGKLIGRRWVPESRVEIWEDLQA